MSSLNFGPDWLRALSGGKDDKPPPTSPLQTMPPMKYKLAEHRYGREEMLGLFAAADIVPAVLTAFPDLLRDRPGQPLAFIAPSEEEERCQIGGVNSTLVLKLAGRVGANRGGRGGIRTARGRGRGDGLPSYNRTLSSEENLQGRGEAINRRPWVDPSSRNFYDKGRTESQPAATHEQRNRLSSDGRPPGNWRSPGQDDDNSGGEWRTMSQKSWRRSDNGKSWRDSNEGDNPRNRSWNRSDHDRNATDGRYAGSSSGNLPEWCDNGDVGPGTFDESGQFKLFSGQGKSTADAQEDSVESQLSPLDNTESKEPPDDSAPSNHSTALQHHKTTTPPPANAATREPSATHHDVPSLPNSSTVESARDTLHGAIHIENGQHTSTASTEDGEIDMTFGHVKSIIDGLDSEEEDVCNTADPSILYVKQAHSASPPGKDMQNWLYKDPRGEVQGPFSSEEMLEWFKAGYFTVGLLIRRVCDDIFLPLGDVIKIWSRVPFISGSSPPPMTTQVLANQQAHQRQESYQRALQEQVAHQKHLQQQKQRIEQQRLFEQQQQQHLLIEQQQQQRALEHHRQQQQMQQEQQMLMMHEKRMKELETQKQQLLMQQVHDKRHIEQALLRDLKISAMPSSPVDSAPQHLQSPTATNVTSPDIRSSPAWGATQTTTPAGAASSDQLPGDKQQSQLLMQPQQGTPRQNTPSPTAMESSEMDNDGFQSQLNRKQRKLKKQGVGDRESKSVTDDLSNEDAQSKAQEALQQKHHTLLLQRHQQMQQMEHQRHLQAVQQQQQQQEQQQQQMKNKMLSVAQNTIDAASWQKSQAASSAAPSLIEIQRIEEERQRELKRKEQTQILQQQRQLQDQKAMAGWAPTTMHGANSMLKIQQEEARRQQLQQQPKSSSSKTKAVTPKSNSASPWSSLLQPQQLPSPVADTQSTTSFWDDVMKPTPVNQPHPGVMNPTSAARTAPSAPSQGKVSKKTRDEATVQRIFQDQQCEDFVQWVEKTVPNLKQSVEVPTFIAFLKDIDSPQEVEEYVRSYLGNTTASSVFLAEFLRRKNEKKSNDSKVPNEIVSSKDNMTNSEDASRNDAVQSKKANKKKKKMQKVDPYLLGFSCNAGADIVNRGGEIMKAEDAWNMKR